MNFATESILRPITLPFEPKGQRDYRKPRCGAAAMRGDNSRSH